MDADQLNELHEKALGRVLTARMAFHADDEPTPDGLSTYGEVRAVDTDLMSWINADGDHGILALSSMRQLSEMVTATRNESAEKLAAVVAWQHDIPLFNGDASVLFDPEAETDRYESLPMEQRMAIFAASELEITHYLNVIERLGRILDAISLVGDERCTNILEDVASGEAFR